MFGWSPPNILATLVLCFVLLLHFTWSTTQAKPYLKQNSLSAYTTGSISHEGDWPELVEYKNGQYVERNKRSPTQVVDETPDTTGENTLSVNPGKRQGIETPIQPLTSYSGLDLSHLNTDQNVRSKVDQPESESVGVSMEEEKKDVDDKQESKENDNDLKSSAGKEPNKGHQDEYASSSNDNLNSPDNKEEVVDNNRALPTQDKANASKDNLNKDSTNENTNRNIAEVNKADSGASVVENAQVRSIQNGVNQVQKLENIPNDKSNTNSSSISLPLESNQASSVGAKTKTSSKQRADTDASKIATAKPPAPVTTTTSTQTVAASAENSPSAKPQISPQESAPINTVPQVQSVPVRDALGNSGSEIVTTQTRGAPELDSYPERDAETKPSNGPEVGHFQVDDKSADLEINANSAGVKVKAKPASLQVVSRPGSHPASGAQERTLFPHYHYPPFHPHHHWFPGMRRSYAHFHRRHPFNPYQTFPERRGYEGFYDEAPFYRRHVHYWYPHRHRHHFRDSDLYERSRLEEPEEFSRYRQRRRHKRRFRHMNGPYRRQFFNNIPITSGMNAPPQMGIPPEDGTMPQLPIGLGQPFTQRQNIITPMPPPINVDGNPPAGLLGGMNGANFAINGFGGLSNLNGMNQINSAFNAMNGVNDMNSLGATGLNSLGQMGTMGGLPEGINGALEGMPATEQPGITRALGTSHTPSEMPRRAFKKTAILSGTKYKDTKKKENPHDQMVEFKKKDSRKDLRKTKVTVGTKKGNVNLKSWEKTLKRYHRLNAFASKAHEKQKFRRNVKSSANSDFKETEQNSPRKHTVSPPHAQHAKDVKGKRKNEIVIHRPPIIYHPPPEIYHRPDIVVHRAPIMLHRPPIIYHQPPVVVHRPAIIYHQPPIVFHQPPPMVHQPILHSHDTWVTKPVVYHTTSTVSHEKTYFGVPNHVYAGTYGEGCHGGHCSYRKGHVPHSNHTKAKNFTVPEKKKTKRDSFSDYMAYFTSLWKGKDLTKRNIDDAYDFIASNVGAKQKLSYTDMNAGVMSKRNSLPDYNTYRHSMWNKKVKRDTDDSRNGTEKKKKKDVVVNRPPIIYHPPPEIYHRPDIVVHRPPLVIHRPPIIYHQPPVIVHRPAVVYHQPPIVFHQPPPAVSQPLLYSHDSFTVHPSFFATHHGSVVRDFGHYVGVPNVITNYGNPLFGRGPPIGKRSKIETPPSNDNATSSENNDSTSKKTSLEGPGHKTKNESSEKAGKKNTVLVHRPPIIYHPPPEIYHRPIIVVHRPPIMIHRAPIYYHQPPIVVHRPAIVYHQPPLIFHQPPPMVHQPVLKSHDTWISHPVVVPYTSRVMHHHTYVGVPDAYTVHHFGGEHGFYKSHIVKHTHHDDENAFERNKITGEKTSTKTDKDSTRKRKITSDKTRQNTTLNLKTTKKATQKGGKKNAVIVRRPPVIYHPPPEIYHRPDIVVHRAPIVIHRAAIIYHQPPVIVHRPAIVYHQPPLIFHQPPPVVHQPVYRSHDTYVHRPAVSLYGSRLHHAGHLYHVPHAYYHGHGGAIHYMAYGKSKVPKKKHYEEEKGNTRTTINSKKGKRSHRTGRKHNILTKSKDKTETGTKLHKNHKYLYHKAKEITEKANKKNSVVIHRPPIIYHPPPEIYHRPDIVVHRAPIVLYRAPIVYHQPPVVVHRPAIVYHQPPIVFHQPPPMVHQPVLHSHDTWVAKPVVVPYASHVRHIATYRGVPHEEIFMHGIGAGAFGKSRVPVTGSRRNEIDSGNHEVKNKTSDKVTKTKSEVKKLTDQRQNRTTRATYEKMQGKERLGAAKRIRRALTESLTDNEWELSEMKSPVGAGARIHRSLLNSLSFYTDQHSSTVVNSQGYHEIPEEAVDAATGIQRSIGGSKTSMGPGARIQRAIAEPLTSFEGENPYPMFKRSSEETENSSTPDENAEKNTNSTKKTLLIIHRPPILYHPPSHMIHRPSIVVHRPDIIVHRHPIVFHRPPILVHRAPIIIHRQPVLIHRPPIIVHRPPLVFHRPPIIIHRRPYIIHHHPILFHRPPIIVHRGPQMIVHHSHLIHHYPMHMIHMTCPGCGYGKSTVARLEGYSTEHDNNKTSQYHRLLKDANVKDSQWQSSNTTKRSVADKKSSKPAKEDEHHKKRKDGHKKKKDVVVNRPPIIYHPPPEVYHRPDIVVHRAPILIHRPPIVYHQPPVVVHRPAVVYHQPPIVFHQPAPAVNQPLLYSHDNFVVHPMAFASHMGSVVNDAGHYVGIPHGGVTNYPGNIPHGHLGQLFPSLNPHSWSRRAEVSKPRSGKKAKVGNGKRSAELKHGKNGKGQDKNDKPVKEEVKQAKGERKNKVIVARPSLIYHPPPEIYDQPDVVVHRPDIVIHRPSIVYHQPSVVVHRAPVVYQQPPVVFHQPSPMVSQPIYHAHDTYVAHPVYHPQTSHVSHSSTYVGAPHYYPGHNSYGWGLPGNAAIAPPATARVPFYGYQSGSTYPGFRGYGFTPSAASYGTAFGRSKVENEKSDKSQKKDKMMKSKTGHKERRRKRSSELSKRHFHRHHHHHHHHHHHGHHYRGSKRFYHFRPISSFAHLGHRKHVVIIHRPPLIYRPPPQVYRRPDIMMHLPPLVYHRPALMFQQPPTIVHHPPIVYHQPPVVFHNPPSIVHSPVIHSHDMFSPNLQHIMVPTSSYVHPAGNYFGPVVSGPAYGKSDIERTEAKKDSSKTKSEFDSESKHDKPAKSEQKRNVSNTPEKDKTAKKGSKKQNVDLVVHQPPIVYRPPPDIFDKPPVIMHQPPMVVHRPPIIIHRVPVVVHRPPVIIHRPPIILHHPAPIYHVAHGHFFHPMRYAFGKSTVEGESQNSLNENEEKHDDKKNEGKVRKPKTNVKEGEKKNTVLINRPAMIYHPPPEIYDQPNLIVHRPDVIIHRPSIVYHQPSVVVHRPPVIYHQPPVVFHQPSPMVHQPVLHAHDTYLAHPVPVPYTSQIHHTATYVGAPHFFNQASFGGYSAHAFGKSEVEKIKNLNSIKKDGNASKKKAKDEDKSKTRSTRNADSKKANETKNDSSSLTSSKSHKKNKVIINRPALIYHPPPEIYDKPDLVVHRPDIIIHRPSIVYHQPSVVVHRPAVVYQAPTVVFHQPPPLVNQPIMHAHDTYVAHPVPVPHSSYVDHTSTYVGSPHYYPGGWNHGWIQPSSNGLAYGKSNVPATKSKTSRHSKSASKDKVKRSEKDTDKNDDKEIKSKSVVVYKKKNQVLIHRPPLIYHPPPEVYHKPDVIVHRPDIVIHRPAVVYHQPSVVVHRPPVVYHQPPVVFHQPSPMVSQPVLHAHDMYVAHPYFTPYSSDLYHGGSYVGAPHFYNAGWGGHGYGLDHAFGKSEVEGAQKKQRHDKAKNKKHLKDSRRTLEKEVKEKEDEMTLKNQTDKVGEGNKKNLVIMRRPPLIYHPPPEIYDKPDVIMHRPDLVIHRPSIVFHQPSVVVHRPPVIYHQPPVIFHQPSPMVHQPILHAHDTYVAHPHFVPFTSHVQHTGSYVGAPHFYPGGWGFQGHGNGFDHAFGKSKVEKTSKHQRKSKSEAEDGNDSEGDRSLPVRETSPVSDKFKFKKKIVTKGHKKNVVIMRRPSLIYHPPPEIYHKPDIILHRPDIVIHRPSVVFHQPSVVVHRPPVIYHQPPVVFHQPSPMVHQPIFHSHETYVAHPHFVPYLSHVTHAGSYVGAPHFFPGHWGPSHGFGHFRNFGHAFGKSKVEKGKKKDKFETVKTGRTETSSKKTKTVVHKTIKRAVSNLDLRGGKQHSRLKQRHTKLSSDKGKKKVAQFHPEKEDKKVHHKGHKKNLVLLQRPALIYHPPPEVYDRPDIIVHRPDVVIHQPSVVYHQPSVVVHRPPIIYHPPPVVFHQPTPMVRQPVYTSHDTYHSYPNFVPYASHINHEQTYVGAPHYYPGGWGHGYGYGLTGTALAPNVEPSRFNSFGSPWFKSPSYGSNYIAPTGPVVANGMRNQYRSAFAKSNVFKHDEKNKDSKKTDDYKKKKKERDTKKSGQVAHKEGKRNRRSVESVESSKVHSTKTILHTKGHEMDKGGKKNFVVINRPSLVYHPPTEIYHKPDVIIHRPDVVIHQPSVVYHQPSVVVHRPPIIYNQPPVVFHQPAPMVNQPIFHSHENYIAHPTFVPYTSQIHHSGTYVGAPDFFSGGVSSAYGHAFGKSHVLKYISKAGKQNTKSQRKNEMRKGEERRSTKGNLFHPQEKKNEKASKKNDIVVSRPPIIYHPPPEIYHRPDIVVHRAPIVLHRPPIIYHQPPVVVHRPAVVYHQPPVVFHQPPPTVHQPILHSHDSFVVHPAARFYPQGSTISHSVSYVGIPNHVIHGDELGFEHLQHFHRSQIEHSGKDKSTTHMAKSTISKIPTTNKENTETTITDQTQKKTLRSKISQPTRTKRQLIGSHSLFGSLSPINNVQDSQQSVEQNEKLSTIPGVTSNRENDIAKRQLIVPESTENEYHPSLPSVYNTLEMAALQNQALAASETLRPPNGDDEVHMPDFASTLTALQGLGRPGIGRYPFSLQSAPKDDSPDVRVHVETTKSSIPVKARKKRQLFPLFQQQNPAQIPHVLFQSPSLGNLEGTIHATTPPSVYHLLSPFHPMYHPIGDPYNNYLGIASQLQHRPHVNINVQSARSIIPDIEHDIQKRSGDKKSKREFLAITPPLSPGFPFGVGTGMMNNYLSYSPYPALSRLPYPLMPRLNYQDESEEEESAFPEALSLHRPSPIPHSPYSTLSEDEDNNSPELNPLASYLSALYNSFLGYPYYHRHHKPKVRVEVHASKSQIPKATENKQEVHSRISKRQLYNFLPGSPLTENHYPLPAALNYGIQGFHKDSPRVSVNVETAKKNGIPIANKEKRSSVTSNLKASQKTRSGEKRDELMENGGNSQVISQNQGNYNYLNQPDNQFVATSESSQPQQEVTSSNENEPIQGMPQQQSDQQTNEQPQEQQRESGQQTVPEPNQPMMVPFQAQQLAYRAPLAPIQVPMQLPMQSALQTPLVPSYMVPSQGMIPSALPVASNIAIPEQQYAQQTSDIEDGQPKHTSINVNVAAKSSVPKKTTKKSKTFHAKRQFVDSPQGYGIPIKTTKKSAMEKGPGNHQSISLLTRFPAMQVLPQTFKQNGVMMPAFNTLPVNHRIKANGMLLEELQRQRKHRIPKKDKEIKIGKKENAKKRQFYVVPQSPIPIQQYASALNPSVHPRPRVSVNVEVNKRKFVVPIEKHLKGVKREKQSKEETKAKRQVYGIERLPNMVQMPLANPPLLSQIPLKSQQPRVSVNVEIAKKKATLLKQKRQKLKRANKEKRQIYGLSELPHEGLIQQPFSLASQTQHIGYLPSTLHSPHVSINVETSKRSEEEVYDNIHKRQVLGLQPGIGETFDQAQEPISPSQASFQSGEVTQENAAQQPIQVRDQSKSDESSLMATQSNFLSPQQQQADELPSAEEISRDALSNNLNERPHVSIHVEASKRGKSERKQRKNSLVKRGAKGEKGDKREFLQIGQMPEDYQPNVKEQETETGPQQEVSLQVPEDYQPNFKEQETVAGPQQDVSLQQQQHVSQQPFTYLPLIQQQQQVQQLQPIMLPVEQSAAEKPRPKVSINVQASKSSISKNNDNASEQRSEKKLRRQLLSTIPLLSSLGQTTAPDDVRRSTVTQPIVNRGRIQDRIQRNKMDRRSWKRQLYNYLGGQQEQQILPGQALQDTTETEQQQENIPVQPVQVFQQDSNLQAQMGVPQASLFETTNQANLQQYPSQIEVPRNSQQASVSPIQSEPSLTSLGSLQNPHVSINVQTAKSHVPNRLTTKRSIFERQKVKRQFDILGGGGVIERRRGPKFLSVPLKKPRVRNMFGLGNNLNKPVGVFSDPLANLLAGGISGRKRPKLGGIRLDSPTGVGALPIKEAANPLGGALSSDVGVPAILQDNAAQAIAPFVQEPAVTGRTPLFPPSGIAGPRVDAIGNGETGEFPLADLPSSRPAILPLRTVNQAVIPNLPFEAAAPPPQVRPLLLAPRVFPIFPMPPPMAVPPPMLEGPAPELPHVPPQIGPVLPPVWPMPLPNMEPPPPLPSPESLFPESDGDKPSVHVNVETSRSNVPVVKSHPKKQANGPANRG